MKHDGNSMHCACKCGLEINRDNLVAAIMDGSKTKLSQVIRISSFCFDLLHSELQQQMSKQAALHFMNEN